MRKIQFRFGRLARLAFVVSLFAASTLRADDLSITDPAAWLVWLMSRIGVPGG